MKNVEDAVIEWGGGRKSGLIQLFSRGTRENQALKSGINRALGCSQERAQLRLLVAGFA